MHLKSAIKKAGGPAAVGRALGITSAAVSQWRECPSRRVLVLEALSGVPRHAIRPDIYPPHEFFAAPRPQNEAASA
ncbi:Cro/CI family transcriptional regulator [Methylobacterium sp. B4]|uniref:transcriptional regulator n=1 Tax=Methylobacterium sp. B4 TaxID=1938755 RepID=UPI001FDF2D07|nr:Cro/CI family transcriptional regulator [Methylobacterium sp. B4]